MAQRMVHWGIMRLGGAVPRARPRFRASKTANTLANLLLATDICTHGHTWITASLKGIDA
eukprot:4670557-Pleurochrysis_carterae.AAC.1